MPHEGYADPITNDGPGFPSNVPVSELTERVTRAIEASDVSSAPPVADTSDGVTHETRLRVMIPWLVKLFSLVHFLLMRSKM